MELHLNDILELKKDHPCGSRRWQVLRGHGHQAQMQALRPRGDAAPPQGGENDQAHHTEGGAGMKPKWVRYMAMGIALLLAIVMLVSLVLPYLGL